MIQNNTNLVILGIIEDALKGQTADLLLNIVNTSLRDHEKEVFAAYFGIGCPKQSLEAIAQATGRTVEHTEAILSRLLLKLRKNPEATDIWRSVDQDSLPEQFQFSAGAHGASVYHRYIDRDQMERCWQHPEYQCACKKCGSTAYVYGWAGNCASGGYWQVKVWCPKCNSYHDYHLNDNKPIDTHWTGMRAIIESEEQKLGIG